MHFLFKKVVLLQPAFDCTNSQDIRNELETRLLQLNNIIILVSD